MTYCAVLECKNDSRQKNVCKSGVSYHKFPKNPDVLEAWVRATGKTNWTPTKSSHMCSDHFAEKEFMISKKGYRYLCPSAVPTKNLVVFCENIKVEAFDIQPPPTKKPRGRGNTVPSIEEFEEEDESSTISLGVGSSTTQNTAKPSARETKLKGMLRWCLHNMKEEQKKIKQLQSQNRRLKKKLENVEDLLKKTLEGNYVITDEDVKCLKKSNIDVVLI